MSQTFKKVTENFTCEHCGAAVIGNGFTNHCPKCLWSKHVDIHPGDRSADCGGQMEPILFEKEGDTYTITHRCIVCGHTKRNKIAKDDDFDVAVKIGKKD